MITNLGMDLFQALVQVVMDPDSVRCPPPYNPDYLGWIMGKWGVNNESLSNTFPLYHDKSLSH